MAAHSFGFSLDILEKIITNQELLHHQVQEMCHSHTNVKAPCKQQIGVVVTRNLLLLSSALENNNWNATRTSVAQEPEHYKSLESTVCELA